MSTLSLPDVVTRDERLVARTALLSSEKELIRQRDELNTARRRLPAVEVDKGSTSSRGRRADARGANRDMSA